MRARGQPHCSTRQRTKEESGILSPTRGSPGLRAGFRSPPLSKTVVTGPGRRRDRRLDGTVTMADLVQGTITVEAASKTLSEIRQPTNNYSSLNFRDQTVMV